jgi:hypothetical protein
MRGPAALLLRPLQLLVVQAPADLQVRAPATPSVEAQQALAARRQLQLLLVLLEATPATRV